jgi:hypothetical protein
MYPDEFLAYLEAIGGEQERLERERRQRETKEWASREIEKLAGQRASEERRRKEREARVEKAIDCRQRARLAQQRRGKRGMAALERWAAVSSESQEKQGIEPGQNKAYGPEKVGILICDRVKLSADHISVSKLTR